MNKSKKAILISSIPAFLTAVFVIFILFPTGNNLFDTVGKLKMKKNEYNLTQEKLEQAKDNKVILKEIEILNGKLINFDVNVPENNEIAILLIDLEKFAEQSNINIIALDSKEEKDTEIKDSNQKEVKKKSSKRGKNKKEEKPLKLFEIPIEIQTLGYFNDILKFINILEKYERVVSIDGILMKDYEKDDKKTEPRVKITINASIYKAFEQEIPFEVPEKEKKNNSKGIK